MRLAFVDLLFSWPPHGGADVDLFHVAAALQRAGHDVFVLGLRCTNSWERGVFEPDGLPFPAQRLDCPERDFTPRRLPGMIRGAVTAWCPDAVFVGGAFFMKPYVTEALADYPVVSRYYAYELACQRDILRFKNNAPCPNNYLETPDVCRACAIEALGPDIRRQHHLAWTQEYLAARAYDPGYHRTLTDSLRKLHAAVVSNEIMRDHVTPYCDHVFILPGGVDADYFGYTPARNDNDRKVILMTGRGEDAVKGLPVLHAAATRLWESRQDFELRVTLPEDEPAVPWLRPLGWCDREGIRRQYQDADVVVAPSVWDEPFGLVALEAMATGRPVCASRVGGLQDLVTDGETGLLFPRGNDEALATHLATLLDRPDLRAQMGAAGRRRVEEDYTWDQIVAKRYPPLLAHLETGRR